VSHLTSPKVDALASALDAHFGQRLRRNERMAAHTTLRVGGPADLWLTVTSLDELIEAAALAWHHQVPAFLLGGGANLLVSDQGVRGLMLQNRCQQVTFPSDGPGDMGAPPYVIVESGMTMPSLARRLAHQGLSGLEWAVSVPGTIGGGVVNNAGAYGRSIADSLVRAELYSQADDRREWQSVNWFEYDYRSSRLKRLATSRARAKKAHYVVLRAELALSRMSPVEIESQMAVYNRRRRASQPTGASIGSMFRNPPDDFAGRLIDAAGLKGRQIGGAQISPVHANFFINTGEATAADFVALIELARRTVKERFDVELELEIQKVGDWGKD
jgi:UDP-N-acetylmuramate dehydrogenase